MKRVRLGRTNEQVAAIGVGTWALGGPNVNNDQPVGWSGADDETSRAALRRAHELGLHHWDTADVYGDGRSETVIGSVFGEVPRDDIFLATKVGWDLGGFEHFYHPDLVRSRIERSLKNLQTDVIDLYYLHHCDFGEDDRYLDGALECIVKARDDGKIRFIGLSDWDNAKVARLADRVNPAVVQVYRNVIDDTYESSGLKAWVDANDAGVAFFSPLKHGLLLGKYDRAQTFAAGDFRSQVDGFQNPRLIAELQLVRDAVIECFPARDEPVINALIAAVLYDAPTACALQGLRSPEQVDQASRVDAELSRDDVEWVRERYQEAAAGS